MEEDSSLAYAEVLEVLIYMDKKYVDKIPKRLLDLFNEGKSKDYIVNINPNISLAEQGLQRKTLALLAMLNVNYWCENDEEKQKLLKIYSKNDIKIENERREKYNPNNLFKKQEKQIIKNSDSENVQLVKYNNENIFKKFINRIIKFFKR